MALRNFDVTIATYLDTCMKKSGFTALPPLFSHDPGIHVRNNSVPKEIVKEKDGTLTLHLQNGEVHGGFEVILCATGRHPNVDNLGLSAAGVESSKGFITVDEYQNTNTPGIYALGDVCGRVELTPMAIAAGRRLSDRSPPPSSLPLVLIDFVDYLAICPQLEWIIILFPLWCSVTLSLEPLE
jgi:glutathione reductase (NADPH)